MLTVTTGATGLSEIVKVANVASAVTISWQGLANDEPFLSVVQWDDELNCSNNSSCISYTSFKSFLEMMYSVPTWTGAQ